MAKPSVFPRWWQWDFVLYVCLILRNTVIFAGNVIIQPVKPWLNPSENELFLITKLFDSWV